MADDNDVRAVVRALSIFDAFDAEHSSLSLQEIGQKVGVPKATAHRLVNTISNAGFLVRLSDQRYSLSPKVARLGAMVRSNLGIRDVALPTMIEVNQATRETVTLNVVAGHHRLCIEVVDTPAPLMTIVRAGEHLPLGLGATGRILLAYIEEKERAAILDEMNLTPEARGAVERELARFRAQGYSITRNQRVQGVTAIAVPLLDPVSGALYSLAVTGPSIRMDPNEGAYIDLMLNAGSQVTGLLGVGPTASVPEVPPSDAPAAPVVSSEKPARRPRAPKK